MGERDTGVPRHAEKINMLEQVRSEVRALLHSQQVDIALDQLIAQDRARRPGKGSTK